MSNGIDRANLLTGAFAGIIIGAMAETYAEAIKELRRYAGGDFDQRFAALEAKAIRSVENASLDGLSETDQLLIVEHARTAVRAIFKNAKTA